MTQLDIFQADRDVDVKGNAVAARTITLGQQVANDDLVVVDVPHARFTADGVVVMRKLGTDNLGTLSGAHTITLSNGTYDTKIITADTDVTITLAAATATTYRLVLRSSDGRPIPYTWTNVVGAPAYVASTTGVVVDIHYDGTTFSASHAIVDSISITDFHLRTIVSDYITVTNGFKYYNIAAQSLDDFDTSPAKICLDYIKFGGSRDGCALLVDCSVHKQFLMSIHSVGNTGYGFKPFGQQLTPLPLSAIDANILGGSSMSLVATGGGHLIAIANSAQVCVVPEGVDTRWVAMWIDYRTLTKGVKIETIQTPTVPSAGVRVYHDLNGPRKAYGTPTAGIFQSVGEIIQDISGANDYFIVTTAGALAPAWSSGVAVIIGELRQNGGRIYSALAAGTTGATAPTHTSGSASDGAVTWAYYSPQAVVAARP